MRTITWEDRVDITLDGGMYGVAVDLRKDEEGECLALYMKDSIISKYLGAIKKINGNVKFIPAIEEGES